MHRATSTPECSPTTARPSRICCSTPSPSNGRSGRTAASARYATRRTAHQPISWTCTRRPTSRKPRAPRFSASSGRHPRPTSPDGHSSPRKRRRGSASISARRSRMSAPTSTGSSSPASTTSSITARPTRRWERPGRAGSSTPPSSSVPRTPGGTTSARSTATSRGCSRSCRPARPITMSCCTTRSTKRSTARGTARLTHFGGASPPPQGTAFEAAAGRLQRDGFTYDFISDRQIRGARVESGRLLTSGGASYRVVVLPSARYVALEAFEHVLALARSGATVVSFGDWPSDVAGLHDLEPRRARFRNAIAGVQFGPAGGDGIREAELGRGRILRGDDLGRLLARAGIGRERLVDHGLQFARRADAAGRVYFLSNPGETAIDGWVPLERSAPMMHVFDPMSGRWGSARLRSTADGRDVYLQIPRGGSLIVRAAVSPAPEVFQNYAVTARAGADRRAVDGALHHRRADAAGKSRDPAPLVMDQLRRRRRQLFRHRELHHRLRPAVERKGPGASISVRFATAHACN